MLLGDILSGNARRVPRGWAWRYGARRWSWSEANDRVIRLADSLVRSGIKCQDRVALLANNSNHYIEILFALAKAGIIAVPINSRASGREIDFILQDVEAKALVISAEHASVLPSLKSDKSRLAIIGMGDHSAASVHIEKLIADGMPVEPGAQFDDTINRTIKYTSGTTGDPKGCIGSHRTMMFSIQNYLSNAPRIEPGDLCLMFVPLASGFGLNTIVDYAYREAETIILDKFHPAKVLDTIEREKVVRTCAVPTMINALVDEQERAPRDLSSLRMIGYTGSAASLASIRRAMGTLKCDLYQGYGSTESGSRVTYLSPEEHRALLSELASSDSWGQQIVSCGRELPGYELRIVDDEGAMVSDGEVGELVIRGDSVFFGYWKRPDKTSEALKNGWLYSGDLARKDSRGYFYIVDRKRDMIVSGGYNVYSIEVESVILELDAVSEVAVIGVFDERWGEAIHAFVVPKQDAAISADEIVVYCRTALAGYKCPKAVTFVAEIPKTSTGKIQKSKLKAGLRSAD